jgi:hypothetical protein
MEYKGFSIKPYEQEPGKWRVRAALVSEDVSLDPLARQKLQRTLTGIAAATTAAVVKMAMETVDTATRVARPKGRGKEKFWRVGASAE